MLSLKLSPSPFLPGSNDRSFISRRQNAQRVQYQLYAKTELSPKKTLAHLHHPVKHIKVAHYTAQSRIYHNGIIWKISMQNPILGINLLMCFFANSVFSTYLPSLFSKGVLTIKICLVWTQQGNRQAAWGRRVDGRLFSPSLPYSFHHPHHAVSIQRAKGPLLSIYFSWFCQ